MFNIQWKEVAEATKYEISNTGLIRNTKTGRILKPRADKDGYLRINLSSNEGKVITRFIHRLVGIAFIPNPNGLPLINHKDETKTNNNVENLEWCDHVYNVNYGTARQRRQETLNSNEAKGKPCRFRKKVYQYNKALELTRIFNSMLECADYVGLHYSSISKKMKNNEKNLAEYGDYFYSYTEL